MSRTLSSKLVFLAMLLLAALFDLINGAQFFGDVDDWMRDYQIRDLLADGQWYDLSIPFISMPEIYVSPWSRLVDFPYLAITFALTPMFGETPALLIAYKIWPPTMLVGFGLSIYAIIHRSLGTHPKFTELIITIFLLLFAIWEFVPGSIDHHNMQLLLMATICYGLVRWDGMGAILFGLAIVASVHVGLETLPMICVALLGLGLTWVMGLDDGFMFRAAMALIAAVAIFTTIQPGWGNVMATACDAYSAPYVLALSLIGLFLFVASKFGGIIKTPLVRLLLLSAMGLVLLGILAIIFPQCLQGPYHMIDPVSRDFWLDTLEQENGIFSVLLQNPKLALTSGLLQFLFVPGFVVLAISKFRDGSPAWATLCPMMLVAMIMTIYQMRFIIFFGLLVVLSAPWSIRNLLLANLQGRSSKLHPSPIGIAVIMGLPLLVVGAGAIWYFSQPAAMRQASAEPKAIRYLQYDTCPAENLANQTYLKSIDAGRILAGDGASIAIAEILTRSDLNHKIVALPFHRASPGVRKVAIAFTYSNEDRDEVLREFEYVAICMLPPKLSASIDMSDLPLFSLLNSGKSSDGFELMAPPEGTRLRIFKITAPIK